MQKRLNKTFDRLAVEVPIAYELICGTSKYRCAVQETFWLTHLRFMKVEESQRDVVLQMLKDRFLVEVSIESDRLMLRQHNLVRSVALRRLKEMG